MAIFSFDSDNFDIEDSPAAGGTKFPALPNGNYNVVILDADLEENDKGEYIGIKMEITDGDFSGQWVWDKLWLSGGYFDGHDEMGQKNLARILKYSGIGKIKKRVEELIDAEFGIKTKQSPNKNDPDKPYVNVAFYNPKGKAAAASAAPAKKEKAAPAGAGADLDDEPPF